MAALIITQGLMATITGILDIRPDLSIRTSMKVITAIIISRGDSNLALINPTLKTVINTTADTMKIKPLQFDANPQLDNPLHRNFEITDRATRVMGEESEQ